VSTCDNFSISPPRIFLFSAILIFMSVNLKDVTQPTVAHPSRGFVDGCFDLMHSGHYNALRQAKSMCFE